MKPQDRQRFDRIARAVVSGRRGYSAEVDRMADGVACLMRNRLEAAGAPGARAVPRTRRAVETMGEPAVLEALLERAGKHLASAVLTRGEDGGSRPR